MRPAPPTTANPPCVSLRQRLVACSLLAACAALSLLPLLSSGYYSDDLVNSSVRGVTGLTGVTLFEHLRARNVTEMSRSLRFFPLNFFLVFPAYWLFPGLLAHKLYVLALVVANVLLFARFVETVSGDFRTGCLAALLLPLLIQFRLYHDPVLSFAGHMQIITVMLLLSLLLFQRYLERGGPTRLAGSLLCFNAALYTYEISLPLVALFVILAVFGGDASRTPFARARKALPHVVSTACALAASGAVRLLRDRPSADYKGVALNPDGWVVAQSLAVQASAALPLSYRFFDPANLFDGGSGGAVGVPEIAAAAGFSLAFLAFSRAAGVGVRTRVIMLLGGALWLLPALMISVSTLHQRDLRWGIGYRQVYLEYFGVALAAVGAVAACRGRLRPSPAAGRIIWAAAGLLLVFCLLLNLRNNWAVVEQSNAELHYRRAALVEGLRGGILAPLPENARLFIVDRYFRNPRPGVDSHLRGWGRSGYRWKNAALVYQFAGKRLRVADGDKVVVDAAAETEPEDAYLLEIESPPEGSGGMNGYLVLSKVVRIEAEPGGKPRFLARRLTTSLSPEHRPLPTHSVP